MSTIINKTDPSREIVETYFKPNPCEKLFYGKQGYINKKIEEINQYNEWNSLWSKFASHSDGIVQLEYKCMYRKDMIFIASIVAALAVAFFLGSIFSPLTICAALGAFVATRFLLNKVFINPLDKRVEEYHRFCVLLQRREQLQKKKVEWSKWSENLVDNQIWKEMLHLRLLDITEAEYAALTLLQRDLEPLSIDDKNRRLTIEQQDTYPKLLNLHYRVFQKCFSDGVPVKANSSPRFLFWTEVLWPAV